MKEIALRDRNGLIRAAALVDDEDFEWLNSVKWSLHCRGYAQHYPSPIGGKRLCVLMHRHILGLGLGDGLVADHINANRLDNRRENLRVGDYVLNAQNTLGRGDRGGRYRGASWDKANQKWMAHAHVGGKFRNLGRYATEEEAAHVADAYRREHMPGYVPARQPIY